MSSNVLRRENLCSETKAFSNSCWSVIEFSVKGCKFVLFHSRGTSRKRHKYEVTQLIELLCLFVFYINTLYRHVNTNKFQFQ